MACAVSSITSRMFARRTHGRVGVSTPSSTPATVGCTPDFSMHSQSSAPTIQ
jgi:hypothetical protein